MLSNVIETLKWRLSQVGTYELWRAEDGTQVSLFMPKNQTPETYHLHTHVMGHGGDGPAWEGDQAEDMPMVLLLRFWAPCFEVAKLVRDARLMLA